MNKDAWMAIALDCAKKAAAQGEVPVGAVVVKDGKLIANAWNQMIQSDDPSAHAEILALREAGRILGNYRLPGCELYVTLEPCLMCAGAILHARIASLHFAASDEKTGAITSLFQVLDDPRLNHTVAVHKGELAEPCSALISGFFAMRRSEKKAEKEKARAH